MRKVFLILPAVILTAACMSSTTNVTRKPGIDYEKYRNLELMPDASYTGVTSAPQPDNDVNADFVGESRYTAKSAYGDAVVTVGTKKFTLGNSAGENDMRVFQTNVDKAYMTAKKAYNPAGFTYSLSPAGAVNPMSDMEVQCILSQDSADNVGQKTCDLFFKSLKSGYAADANAPL